MLEGSRTETYPQNTPPQPPQCLLGSVVSIAIRPVTLAHGNSPSRPKCRPHFSAMHEFARVSGTCLASPSGILHWYNAHLLFLFASFGMNAAYNVSLPSAGNHVWMG